MLNNIVALFDSGAGGGGGSFESIATATPTSGTSITFSSIPQTYKHLQIRYHIKTSDYGSFVLMRVNGATGSVYTNHYLEGNGSVVSAGGATANTSISRLQFPVGTNPTYPNVSIIDLQDYSSSTNNKTIRWFSGQDNNGSDSEIVLGSSVYLATTAISSIEIYGITYQAGSSIALYGIKG